MTDGQVTAAGHRQGLVCNFAQYTLDDREAPETQQVWLLVMTRHFQRTRMSTNPEHGGATSFSQLRAFSFQVGNEISPTVDSDMMSISASVSASSLQQLEDSGTSKPNGQGHNTDDADEGTAPENVSLPESASSGNPRLEVDHCVTQRIPAPGLSGENSRRKRTAPNFNRESEAIREVGPQLFGTSKRVDDFLDEEFDKESFLDVSLKLSDETGERVDEIGRNVLQIAVDSAETQTVALLLKGSNTDMKIEARDDAGWTALHHAVLCADMHIFHLLIECGADIEAVSYNGARPLWMAANTGKETVATYLINCDANIESFNCTTGTTALFEAVKRGDVPIAQMLLENGAGVDTRMVTASAPIPRLPPGTPGPCGGQRIQALRSHPIWVEPQKKVGSGPVIAWLGGSPRKFDNIDKLRRTRQWAQEHELRQPSSSVSSRALEVVGDESADLVDIKQTPLHEAILQRNRQLVELLLR